MSKILRVDFFPTNEVVTDSLGLRRKSIESDAHRASSPLLWRHYSALLSSWISNFRGFSSVRISEGLFTAFHLMTRLLTVQTGCRMSKVVWGNYVSNWPNKYLRFWAWFLLLNWLDYCLVFLGVKGEFQTLFLRMHTYFRLCLNIVNYEISKYWK